MIRVFVLALLGLAALFLVARNLPQDAEGPAASAASESAEASPFARYEGTWEGTLTTYRPDGTADETVPYRREHRRISENEQAVEVSDLRTGSPEALSSEQYLEREGRLERRVKATGRSQAVFTGRSVGDGLVWHRRDDAARVVEISREQILRSAEGDLYLIDGARADTRDGRTLRLYEGRYHRVDRAGE